MSAIDATSDVLREAMNALNMPTEPFEPLLAVAAGRLVLRERGYRELLTRGPENCSSTLFREVNRLESKVDSALSSLGLAPTSAAELAERARGRRGAFDASRLEPGELEQLRRLVAKGEGG